MSREIVFGNTLTPYPLGGRKRSPNLFWDDRLERAAQAPPVNIVLVDQVSASDIVGAMRAALEADGDQRKFGFVGSHDAFDEIEIATVFRILPSECRRTDDVDEVRHDQFISVGIVGSDMGVARFADPDIG